MAIQPIKRRGPHAVADPMGEDLCLTGERVLLRPLRLMDDAAMFVYAGDPEVTRFLPWHPAPSIAAVRPFLLEQEEKRQRGRSLGLAIVLRESGEMIGSTDLMDIGGLIFRRQAEIGYLLARPYWGQGLMTEAAQLTLAHGFHSLRLSRIIAWADAENIGSQRVLEKVGMQQSGEQIRQVKSESRRYLRFVLTRNRPAEIVAESS